MGFMFYLLLVLITYTTRFQYHMMFVSFRSSTTDATSRGGTGASTFTFLFPSSFLPFFGGGGVMLLNLYCYVLLCIDYVYLCPTRFQYHMMFVSFRSSTTGVTSGAETVYRSGASAFTSVFFTFLERVGGSCCSIFTGS